MQLPDLLIERLESFIPDEKKEEVFTAFAHEHAITFRANTLKTTAEEIEKQLTQQGFLLQAVSWYPDAFILQNKSKEELLQTNQYKDGLLYIQNLSSMIPPLVLEPQETDLVLDLTAAPGSKTTEIAALMHNKGLIIANDKSPNRLFKMKTILEEQGVTNTQTLAIPGEFIWKKYPEYFDKVLLDAPCSMEGRISLGEEATITEWSPKKIHQLSNLQKWLLRSAISSTRVGGAIVYSTCALSPEENEEVVDYILKKEKGAVEIEPIELLGLHQDAGLSFWKHKVFDDSLKKTLRIYPNDAMEGFFVAKLRKVASTVSAKP